MFRPVHSVALLSIIMWIKITHLLGGLQKQKIILFLASLHFSLSRSLSSWVHKQFRSSKTRHCNSRPLAIIPHGMANKLKKKKKGNVEFNLMLAGRLDGWTDQLH